MHFKNIILGYHYIINYKHLYDNAISIRHIYHANRGDSMVAEKIKYLREQNGLTQTELARQLGITRSSVNAWEMGISVPSTQYIVELSGIFKVSTDFLLGVDSSASVSVAGLTEKDVQIVYRLISHLKEKNANRD